MGKHIKCGACGADVYTTGTRFPPHEKPEGGRCTTAHRAEARHHHQAEPQIT